MAPSHQGPTTVRRIGRSPTTIKALIGVVVAIVLLSLGSWVLWLGVKPAHAAADPNTFALDRQTCTALEQGYLAQHPERTDLHVNGNDCTRTRKLKVGNIDPTIAGPTETAPGTITTFSMVTATTTCKGYWESTNLNAWGYIQVGYTQVYIGVCYNGSTVTRQYGPNCKIVFWLPNMKGWPDSCGYYGSGTYYLTAYSQLHGQLWIVPFGWCCDKYWWDQYTIDATGDWWWS